MSDADVVTWREKVVFNRVNEELHSDGWTLEMGYFCLSFLQHLTAVSAQAEAKLQCVNEVRHQCKLSWGTGAALPEKMLAVKCDDEQQTFPVHKSPSLS